MSAKALSIAAVLSFAASFAACAPASDTGSDTNDETVGRGDRPIIGGTKASAYPEAVLIDMKQNGQVTAACSGSIIAPKVVLTAGHCVYGFNGWDIVAPYASGQKASATSGATLDWKNASETVDPSMHDVGLIFLSTPINLSSYPKIANTPLANGAQVVNIGRINNGTLSNSNLYVSKAISVSSAASAGYPYDYLANEIIESGDSGGPDEIPGTHTIVAVNSGAGGGTEVLARVDLVYSWIQQQIAAHGGSGSSSGSSSSSSSSTSTSSGSGGTSTCSHDVCASGGKLTSSCDPCAQAICAQDSYCCTTGWDAQCVGEVASICGKTCGGTSSSSSSGGTTTDPCGGVSYVGQCSGNSVVWCENSSLHKLSCGTTSQCKYDTQHGYYNCL